MFLCVTVVCRSCLCLSVFLAVRQRSTRRQRVYSKRARQSTESVRLYTCDIYFIYRITCLVLHRIL